MSTDGDALAATAANPPDPLETTVASESGVGESRPLERVDDGRYVERRLLAQGGMGRVSIARDVRLGRRVALKELRIDNDALRARFERETMLTARLEHPGIVGIHEAGRWSSGEPLFAMRVINGRSLDQRLAEATTLRERLAFLQNVLAVADAMAYAHGEGVIHRDLKPHNVMVGEFGETVVIDWGLAKDVTAGELFPSVPPEAEGGELTAFGSVIGTPFYLPPEQAHGGAVDRRADVYAIGAILYELLSGAAPYAHAGATTQRILDAVIVGPPAPLPTEVPAELRAIVERAMARQRRDRYPSARELAEDLLRFSTGQLVGAHHYSLRSLVKRWMWKRRAVLVTMAIAVVVVSVLGVVGIRNILDERAEAQRQSARADANLQRADDMLSFMQGDLRKQLETANRLDLLEPIARKTIAYRSTLPLDDASAIELLRADRDLIAAQLAGGKLDEANTSIDLALAVVALIANPSARLRRYGSTFFNMRGDIHVQRRDLKRGIASYRRALDVVEELARTEPDELQWQLDILFGLGKLTDALEQLDDVPTALAHAQRAESVLAAIPANPTFSAQSSPSAAEQLASSRGKVPQRLGMLLARIGNHQAALEQLQRAKQVAEQIAVRRPTWTNRRDIAIALERIAIVKRDTGDSAGRIAALEDALAIVDELHARDRGNAVLANDVKELRGKLDAARPPAGRTVRESAGHGQDARVISR